MAGRGRESRLARLAPLLDATALCAAGYGAFRLRFPHHETMESHYQLALLLAVLLALLWLPATRAYLRPGWLQPGAGLRMAAPGLALLFGSLMLAATLTKTTADFSRIWMGSWVLLGIALMALWRLLVARTSAVHPLRVVLLGSGLRARDAARSLQAQHGSAAVAGFIPLPQETPRADLPAPVLGTLLQLADVLAAEPAVTELWLATDNSPAGDEDILPLALQLSSVPLRVVPDASLLRLVGHSITEVAGVTLIELNATPLDGPGALLKEAFDRSVSMFLLILLGPFLLLLGLLVRLDSPGPALFRQPRHGSDGRIIQVLKFRTMVYQQQTDERQARPNDPRITRLGAFLRRNSLDELPQLLNVLRGEMSLVGPRPHPVSLNENFRHQINAYMQRHRVKPGITGWAQVHGLRGETDTVDKMQQRLDYDLYYIEHWSLWLDLTILLRTALRGWRHNAY